MDGDMKPEWSDPNEPDHCSSVVEKGTEQEGSHVSIEKNIRFKNEDRRTLS